MKRHTHLAIPNPDDLLYARAPHPLRTRRGLVLGGGTLIPELNFTLPSMLVNEGTLDKVRGHYRQIVAEATRRAAELDAPGVVLEFETVPDMTAEPDWAVELCRILLDGLAEAADKWQLAGALRITPNDNREMVRPPRMRSGRHWDTMLETFERCADAGAELLSIESVGGKEVHDEALTMCDIGQVLFSLCVMGVRDMRMLWTRLVEIAERHGVHAAGDTACGFGNTAMVLADKQMIPKVFAAVVRAITAVRSLVAYECGAVGPGKDCGYENAILKAITGLPMSMEGKTAACAHLSPVGNLPLGMCDLWSNESVQNVKLLGGMAPTVSMEQLIYDCRLMNRAAADGPDAARRLRDWLVDSDAPLDPQAFILTPDNSVRLAETIVSADSAYHAGRDVAREAVACLREAIADDRLRVAQREMRYLEMMEAQLDGLPEQESAFIEQTLPLLDPDKFVAEDYALPAPARR